MEKIILKTDLSCPHCVKKVEPLLKSDAGIVDYSVNLEHPNKLVTISSKGADIKGIISKFKKVGYTAEIV